jgi:hypothetical protein
MVNVHVLPDRGKRIGRFQPSVKNILGMGPKLMDQRHVVRLAIGTK